MKARVPVPLNSRQKKILHEEIVREYEKTVKRERDNMTRRIIKVILFVLHSEFGFGIGRCAKAFNAFTKAFEESDQDEVFWEHIDRVVIDKLGIRFERDYTEKGSVISETELAERKQSK